MTKRLRILSKDELDFLYALPKFNNDERAFYFDLNQEEVEEINCLRTLESRVHFVLQLGYFKAKFTFFSFSFSQVMEDVLYVLNRYFTNLPLSEKMISQRACFKNNTRILDLVSWNSFDQTSKENSIKRASELVKVCVDPLYIFDGLFDFFNEHRISLPGYSTLQDLIGQALTVEEERLESIIATHLPSSVDEALKKMLVSDGKKMYGITILKKDAKGFNYKEVMSEIKKKMMSEALFKAAKDIIPKLDVSTECSPLRLFG